MSAHRRLRLLPVLALSPLVVLAAAAPAEAQQGEIMRDALSGIGLLEKQQAPIDYHERAPLVMPPKLDGKALPPPRARTKSAAWPKDPEIVAADREREADERRANKGNQVQGRYNDNNATVSVDEMRGGRRAGANLTTTAEDKPGDNARRSSWLDPLELFKGKGEEAAPASVEPPRESLTEPPTGYRKAPKRVVNTSNEPVKSANADREEADPGTYLRSQQRR
ncbi:hypothetical protein [Methylobacterium aerolatum]|uniref:DUF3035 domain-containing protein n=1 Tax=Methylobacterium aerolatum TaxID=418708 RepID=A0ABU0I2L7_9HYPH|nr:hypothetical protein [Methylobacterium aerolatum]MDQ0447956.1 hypothetical protein [Methylobacterium aerolatum]GJD34338.1 hypothetical protein FMGBMHLM_1236 [Methylobacterium aerolatum]